MFDGRYYDWNQKRIKAILSHYGYKFFHDKKLLDLGCGHADISAALYRLGAEVTVVDARQEHLNMIAKKIPGVKLLKTDLDKGWPFANKKYDIILDLGLICHLNDYETHLRNICLNTSYLVLETAVCDSEDPYKCIKGLENKNIYDLSINGVSSRPTAAAIERVLKECGFNFKRIDKPILNSNYYIYDWQSKNNDSCDFNYRRFWFAKKETTASYILPSQSSISQVAGKIILQTPQSKIPPRPIQTQFSAIPSTQHKMKLFYNYYDKNNPEKRQLTIIEKD